MTNISGGIATDMESGQTIEEARVDSRITYPSYKSFDEFIDLERLKSLDEYIAERISRRIKELTDDYFLNLYRLDAAAPYKPGVREVWLSRTVSDRQYDYFDLDKPEFWNRTAAAEEFSLLMDFIETLPFKAFGRLLIIYDDSGAAVPAHRDHLKTDVCNEFVWLRTNLRKPFYMLNHKTNEKLYVDGYSAWFDSVNQFHGSDPVDGLSFSIRVDGVFTDEFRKQIPVPKYNLASTPSFWAYTGAD